MADLDLFAGEDAPVGSDPTRPESLAKDAPLAARMRPATLDEFRGQEHLIGEGRVIRAMLDAGGVASMILWGPPGCGKTTLARLIAREAGVTFVSFSAVTEGVARVREIIASADARLRASGRRTILFCDEIHRFNKSQQDAFLPHVEAGTIILIGATTENPSFEIVRPLLSRAPVHVLEPLTPEDLSDLLRDALTSERGLDRSDDSITDHALDFVAKASDGDARRALGVLETASSISPAQPIDLEVAREAVQHRFAIYDKSGEEHFNLISALHKSVRGSDPDAALYWLARMIDGGEDPLYIARRLVRMASEDVGLADPNALGVVVAARDAFHFLGAPEGELALAQATVYLATAPKSNRAYEGWKRARSSARETRSAPVPLHLRNAPTGLMKSLGYGKGYQYEPETEDGVSTQRFLPDSVGRGGFYRPGRFGFEKTIAERLEWWEARRAERRQESGIGDASSG